MSKWDWRSVLTDDEAKVINARDSLADKMKRLNAEAAFIRNRALNRAKHRKLHSVKPSNFRTR